MEERRKYSRALIAFYILVAYVVLQFLWWSFLLIRQSNQLYSEKLTLNSAFMSPAQSEVSKEEMQKDMRKVWYMIVGEGSVFLCILFLGVMRVRRSYYKEWELLTRQHTFLHSITHEFKSPVASLRLQLETMLKRNLTPEQQQKALSNAIEDTDRLDHLLEKTLTAARIDYGELPLVEDFVNLSVRLNELIDQIERGYPDRKIIRNIENNVFMKIDQWALESIITNLVENAFIYSPPEKPVTINLSWKQEKIQMITLEIVDEGIGISDKDKKKVFWKFYRTDETSGYKGTGLGLFLVEYLVKKHFGSIRVKDNKPQGSIFEISFSTLYNP